MAALLRSIAQQRPSDVKAYDYLGRAELAAGHDIAAAEAFRKAIRLAPRRADLRAMLGEALSMDADGAPSPQAQLAFQEALAIDPTNAPARYYLGRAAISAGRIAQGVAIWRSLAAELPPNDTHRQALLAEIDAVTRHGDGTTPRQAAPSGAQGAESPPIPAAQLGFIRAMVAKQAADLNAHPDDPDGWARLVRSYGVLGDRAARSGALARAKQLFAGRPSALAAIQAAASPGRGAN
jgi:cytochrome c-type biogenesis protein CcmH